MVYVLRPKKKDPANGWCLIGPVKCIRTTAAALCIALNGASYWVPKSQLHPDENEIKVVGDEGMLIVREWIAKEKKWL